MESASERAATTAVTDLILGVFRLNGRLLAAGDRLVAPLGLTSARWQVLGAIAMADRMQPVAWIARDMGLNRQGVQRLVNELAAEGFLRFVPNPHHRRARLVALTETGEKACAAAMALQRPWALALAAGSSTAEIVASSNLVAALCRQLERGPAPPEPDRD